MKDQRADWSAGAALLPFPVAAGTPLGGYATRTGPATSTRDPLTIGALALACGGSRLVIVAADVVAVDAALVDEVAAAAGLDRTDLALCASHTHSGPAGIVTRLHPADADSLDRDLRSCFVTTAAQAIANARNGMVEVDVLKGDAVTVGVAANRNGIAGSYDPRLSVLATRRRDGSLQAVLTHFACHPTILGADNRAVAADFPGALRRALATSLAHDDKTPVVLFVNGAAGDVSTRFTRHAQDAAEVERVGASLATTAMRALERARPLAGPIRHAQTTIGLVPRQRQTGDGDAGIATPKGSHHEDEPVPTTAPQRRIAETKAQGAAMLAALANLSHEAISSRLRLDAWALGGLTLVTIPGELFASLGLAVTAAAPEQTLILGYANGYVGYLADHTAYDLGTYEALASPFAPGTAEHVAQATVTLLHDLHLTRAEIARVLPHPASVRPSPGST